MNSWRRVISGIAAGLALAMIAVTLLSFADNSLRQERLNEIVSHSDESGSLDWNSHMGEDFFTECAIITMEIVRPSSAVRNAFETIFANDSKYHPCESLRYEVLGGAPSGLSMAPYPYLNYPFGSRHLAGALFNFLNFEHLRLLYWVLSYLSVAAIGVAALVSQPRRRAIVASVISVFMLLGSCLQSYGYNIGHSPGFFFGFFALALLVGLPRLFSRQPWRWSFFAALAIILAYFDMFDGAIPIILALSIVFDRLFYSANDRIVPAILRSIGIVATFALGYVVLTGTRLAVLFFAYGLDINRYRAGLMARVDSVDDGHLITYGEIVQRIWQWRNMLAPGGYALSTALILCGLASWIAVVARAQRRTDVTIFAIASLGCIAWLVLFPNHSYIHPWMDIRLLSVPITLGFAAAIDQALLAEDAAYSVDATAKNLPR